MERGITMVKILIATANGRHTHILSLISEGIIVIDLKKTARGNYSSPTQPSQMRSRRAVLFHMSGRDGLVMECMPCHATVRRARPYFRMPCTAGREMWAVQDFNPLVQSSTPSIPPRVTMCSGLTGVAVIEREPYKHSPLPRCAIKCDLISS